MIHRNLGAGLYIDGWDGFILDNWFTANRGGGIVGEKSAASLTCTSNRIEWNGRGGMIFLGRGESFNIVGNFFDRSFGPALLIVVCVVRHNIAARMCVKILNWELLHLAEHKRS